MEGLAAIDGIVLLDKASGMTSNRALQRVKRLFGVRKAGHTGSLDPLATGMLPVCLGQATKVSGFLLGARKQYRAVVQLGVATDTGDADGSVTEDAGGARDNGRSPRAGRGGNPCAQRADSPHVFGPETRRSASLRIGPGGQGKWSVPLGRFKSNSCRRLRWAQTF